MATVTRVIQLSADENAEKYSYPVSLLRQGQVVAFPTETVYGLGANAFDENAVSKIFEAKNRPLDNPVIVHVCNEQMLSSVVQDISERARALIDRFWPGPLTILMPKKSSIPSAVTCGSHLVGVRMPSNEIAKKLIEYSNVPLAAPSANSSGKPSPTCARHVLEDMKDRIPCIIDGGNCEFGLESTIIDVTRQNALVLRPGGITLEQIREVLPDAECYEGTGEEFKSKPPPTPGLKYRHYSPNAKVILYEGDGEFVRMKILNDLKSLRDSHRTGVILTRSDSYEAINGALGCDELNKVLILFIGGGFHGLSQVANRLFFSLRELDGQEVTRILVEGTSEEFEGRAIMNRIRKASSKIITAQSE